jgi:hypothetical protein
MNLTDSQKLFLHNVLFSFVTRPHVDSDLRRRAEEIADIIEDELLNPNTVGLHPHPPDDDSWDEDEDRSGENEVSNDEDDAVDVYYDIDHFTSLPPLRVINDVGDRFYLRFFEEDDTLNFELSNNDGRHRAVQDEVFDVTSVIRGGKNLRITTRDGDFDYEVSKFPTEWTKALRLNDVSAP